MYPCVYFLESLQLLERRSGSVSKSNLSILKTSRDFSSTLRNTEKCLVLLNEI